MMIGENRHLADNATLNNTAKQRVRHLTLLGFAFATLNDNVWPHIMTFL